MEPTGQQAADWDALAQEALKRAFSGAAEAPSRLLVDVRTLIGDLAARGASSNEAGTALQALLSPAASTPEVTA